MLMRLRLAILFLLINLIFMPAFADVGDFAIENFRNTYSNSGISKDSKLADTDERVNAKLRAERAYSSYKEYVKQELKKFWQPNINSSILRTVAQFSVGADGRMLYPFIVSSSGNRDFDDYVLKTIYSVPKYNPVPTILRSNKIDIRLAFGANITDDIKQGNDKNISNVNFEPYMRDLMKRIKLNWNPPKGNTSNRIVVKMKLAKDGTLIFKTIMLSSGNKNADKAALDAIDATKYYPLPAEYDKDAIEIQYTFDYNVAYSPIREDKPWFKPSDVPEVSGTFNPQAYEKWYKEHKKLRNNR